MRFINLFIISILISPIYANAAINTVQDLLTASGSLVNILLGVVTSLAFLVFLWGLVIFIKDAANEEKRNEGKKLMFWGIIALFVLVSIWGIVAFIGLQLGIPIS